MNSKIKNINELLPIIENFKKEGKKIVATNGSFDILHVAHLNFLQKAKSQGDILIIILNSDSSVKHFKGDKRPILPELERATHLAHLHSVDYITIFSEDTPLNYLQLIQPDYHVKGGSFLPERIREEKELIESWGGKFQTFPLEERYSTTNIIQKIIDVHKDTTDANKTCPHAESQLFNRNLIKTKPLAERVSKSNISIMINPNSSPPLIHENQLQQISKLAESIKYARNNNKPVIMCFGAHLIKNGLSLILIELIKEGYITHLVGNGAVSIHDWEFSYQGKTEEDVKKYLAEGQFGIWEETGKYINKAISKYCNQGYGSAIGKMIHEEKLGQEIISHPYKEKSILATAYQLKIPFSICPGIGYDIIYTHPLCDGAAIGKAAYTDFLKYAKSISQLEGGVYLSVGSAITSPMIFEKALSMAKNVAKQQNQKLENYTIAVNDIQPGTWNWSQGEPPKDNPAYYLRFNKSFARMGGKLDYIELDNRAFLHNLYVLLTK